MEPTSNGQTGNETGPKFQVMLVAAESYDTNPLGYNAISNTYAVQSRYYYPKHPRSAPGSSLYYRCIRV
jgi:hypothetical protein